MADYKGITMSLINSGSLKDIQIEHDDREYDENGRPYFSDNVDTNRSADNWYYENNMSIKEFYEREFEPAYRQQQQRNIDARHPERNKFGSYYEEVMSKQVDAEAKVTDLKKQGKTRKDIKREMAATTKVAYQMIVQLGDNKGDFRTLDNSPENIALGKQLLIDFIRDFEKNYPNMKIINAAIHCDEIGKTVVDKETGEISRPGGTLHAHITYCPVAQSYKKGMSARNSITKTLADMGFADDKTKDAETGEFHFGIEKWQQKMRNDFDKHIQKFGYKRIEPAEKSTTHDDISTYQKKQEQKKIIRENENKISKQEETLSRMQYDSQEEERYQQFLANETKNKQEELAEKTEQVDEITEEVDELSAFVSRTINKGADDIAKGLQEAKKEEIANRTKDVGNMVVAGRPIVVEKENSKKKVFGKPETEEGYFIPKDSYKLYEQYVGFKKQEMIGEIEDRYDRISTSLIQKIKDVGRKVVEGMDKLKIVLRLQKENEMLKKDMRETIAAEVKKQVGIVMRENDTLKTQYKELKADHKELEDEYSKTLKERNDFVDELNANDEKAQILGFDNNADMLKQMAQKALEIAEQDRDDDDEYYH